MPWLGVEAGYVELGSTERDFTLGNTQIDGEMSVNGWEGFVVASLPLGPFDVFAKVGGFTGDIDTDGKIQAPDGSTEHFSGNTDNSDALLAYGGAWHGTSVTGACARNTRSTMPTMSTTFTSFPPA